jgi:hypothetical protein
MLMTTSEWLYVQTLLTDIAMDQAHQPVEQEFIRRRLEELRGRVAFEQRSLARSQTDASLLGDENKGW